MNSKKDDFSKRLVRFSLKVISFCQIVRQNRNLVALADQLIRSGTSVGANINEAKSASSRKDYVRYFEIALKSANETSYWLILVKESDNRYNLTAVELLDELNEISKIIASSVLTLKI